MELLFLIRGCQKNPAFPMRPGIPRRRAKRSRTAHLEDGVWRGLLCASTFFSSFSPSVLPPWKWFLDAWNILSLLLCGISASFVVVISFAGAFSVGPPARSVQVFRPRKTARPGSKAQVLASFASEHLFDGTETQFHQEEVHPHDLSAIFMRGRESRFPPRELAHAIGPPIVPSIPRNC